MSNQRASRAARGGAAGALAAAAPIALLLAALEGGHLLWRAAESVTGLAAYGSGFLRHVAASAGAFALATLPLILAEQLAAPERRPRLRSYAYGWLGWLVTWMTGYWTFLAIQQAVAALNIVPPIRIAPAAQGPWLGALLLAGSALLFDFLYYWFHRLLHAAALLWRFHAVHHAIRDLNAVNSFHHPLEDALRALPIALPLALLVRYQGDVHLPIVTAFMGAWGYFIHAHTRLEFGRFRAVLADGAYHRVHHSVRNEDFGRNFVSFFPVWDRIFGTQRMPRAGENHAVGLDARRLGLTLRDYLLGIGRQPRPAHAPAGKAARRDGSGAERAARPRL